MKKYFHLHDYPSRVESRIATYHLQGNASMWWDQLKQATHLDEKRSHGGSSKDVSKRNIRPITTIKGR
jgi:hypothetical protein